uniref:Uncharacterized protein n=1 Tax=Ascaris lumbricoides TaxID=6252 RepID=A0A0M3HR05_ASCLU
MHKNFCRSLQSFLSQTNELLLIGCTILIVVVAFFIIVLMCCLQRASSRRARQMEAIKELREHTQKPVTEREVIIALPEEMLTARNESLNDDESDESPPAGDTSQNNPRYTCSMNGKQTYCMCRLLE